MGRYGQTVRVPSSCEACGYGKREEQLTVAVRWHWRHLTGRCRRHGNRNWGHGGESVLVTQPGCKLGLYRVHRACRHRGGGGRPNLTRNGVSVSDFRELCGGVILWVDGTVSRRRRSSSCRRCYLCRSDMSCCMRMRMSRHEVSRWCVGSTHESRSHVHTSVIKRLLEHMAREASVSSVQID